MRTNPQTFMIVISSLIKDIPNYCTLDA